MSEISDLLDGLEKRMNKRFDRLETRLISVEVDVTAIKDRLSRVERNVQLLCTTLLNPIEQPSGLSAAPAAFPLAAKSDE